ncbi:MAG TPA: outer membrane lipoprotein carrier protein LolA [Caulobacteraceae bacterium]
MDMTTTRRAALVMGMAAAIAAPLPAMAALSASDQALVDKAVGYLQSMKSVKGRFVQTDARGRTTQGDIYLQRPGKARFAYDAPSGLTVVSDGARVSVADKRLKTFNQYPLSSTPLAILLAKEVRLDRGVEVTKVTRLADGFTITARDAGRKSRGQINIVFADAPTRLVSWTVIDAQGGTTRVRLTNLHEAKNPASLFVLKDPRPKVRGSRPM